MIAITTEEARVAMLALFPGAFPCLLILSATVPLACSKNLCRSPLKRIFDHLEFFLKVFASFTFQNGRKDSLADKAFR